MTVVGLNAAIAMDKEIVQIFKRDFTKTFFMLREDYLAEKDESDSLCNRICFGAVIKLFDNQAYCEFKKTQLVRYGTDKSKAPVRMPTVEYVERMYKGIQIVQHYEDISTDFYERELFPIGNRKKFQPEHFRIGTQVTVSKILATMSNSGGMYPSVFTIKGICKNGPGSFVLETTSDDLAGFMPKGEKYKFNIDHVENIVSQGSGVIKIQSPWHIDYSEALEYVSTDHYYPQYAKKNHWLVYGGSMLITTLTDRLGIPNGALVDSGDFMDELLCQHFVKVIDTGAFGLRLYLINKKRAKRFVKQNINRFLSSAKVAQEEYDREMDNHYYNTMEEDLDDNLDKSYPDPGKTASI